MIAALWTLAVTLMLHLLAAIYYAGRISQSLTDHDKRLGRIEDILDHWWGSDRRASKI